MEYRMYVFVLKQLSAMQKGIQASHAIVEYGNEFFDKDEFKEWAHNYKTIIVLNGGTSPEMEEIISKLEYSNIDYQIFNEEDLNYLTTAIAVIADERVWNVEKYPNQAFSNTSNEQEAIEEFNKWRDNLGGDKNIELRKLIFSKKLAN